MMPRVSCWHRRVAQDLATSLIMIQETMPSLIVFLSRGYSWWGLVVGRSLAL